MKLLNLDPFLYSQRARDILRGPGIQVDYVSLEREDLLPKLSGYQGLILRLSHKIDKELLDYAPDLKVIACNATGLDHIDEKECLRRKIKILSLRGEADFLKTVSATGEHTILLILSLLRHLKTAMSHAEERKWDRECLLGEELRGKDVGILGFGRVGKQVAALVSAFGARVHVFDRKKIQSSGIAFYRNIAEFLNKTQILSIHLSLDDTTKGMIGMTELQSLRRGAYVINTSRGAVLDEHALLSCLKEGSIAGAALDVLRGEPSVSGAMIEYARTHPNLIITPHIGGATRASWEKTESFIATKLKRFVIKKLPAIKAINPSRVARERRSIRRPTVTKS